ncbi:hypothetical protein ACHWQZ_G004267 [Mnemiopsis leidyi]
MESSAATTMFFSTYSKPAEPELDEYNRTDIFKLNRYESVFLLGYEFCCTVMTIFLNSYLLLIILFKVKLEGRPQTVPMITAAFFGLFHGFGCNLIMTVSLAQRGWWGSLDWCGAAANIHKYIIYSIIYCQVVVSLEASYMISHPLSYFRDSKNTLVALCIATFSAVFITLPVTIAQFYFLFPGNIQKHWPQNFKVIVEKSQYFFYDQDIHLCYRYFFVGTLDYKIIVYFINAVNTVAAFLIAFSFIVIAFAVLKSRGLKNEGDNLRSPSFNKRKIIRDKQRKRQNFRIARMSIFSTSCVILPWFPSCILSLIDYSGFYDALGVDWTMNLSRFVQFLFYLVPWFFPLMVMATNPDIARANKLLVFRTLPGFSQSRSCNPVSKSGIK